MRGMVDLHCHLLPNVDDGPTDTDGAIGLFRGLGSLGFSVVVATPHDRPPRYKPSRDAVVAARDLLARAAGEGAPRLELAAEVYFDDTAWQRFETGSLIKYPGDWACLVEFGLGPGGVPLGAERRIFEMRVKGTRPIIAHPERYEQLGGDLDALERLVNAGALLMISLTSLGGGDTPRVRRRAERIVGEGLATLAGSDGHAPSDLKSIERGLARLHKLLDREEVEAMMCREAALLLEPRR